MAKPPKGVRSGWSAVAALVMALALMLTSGAAVAQGGGSLGGGGSTATEQVEADTVLQSATRAFERSGRTLAERLRGEYEQREQDVSTIDLEQRLDEYTRRFTREAGSALDDLEGDGILAQGEVSAALSRIRDTLHADLQDAYRAALEGYEPPPTRGTGQSLGSYIWALVKYTLITRNPIMNWLLLLGCLLIAMLAAVVVTQLLKYLSDKLRTVDQRMIASMLGALIGPLFLSAFVIAAAVGLRFIWIPAEAAGYIWLTIKLLFALAGVWLFWNVCGVAARVIRETAELTNSAIGDHGITVIRRILRMVVLIIAILVVTNLVFNASIFGWLTGLGVLGLIITFAAQDLLRNLIASFTIFGDEPFKIGDLIKFQGYFGPVEDVGFRSTVLRDLDGELITIPNSMLTREPVENITARPWIRRRFHIDLIYQTTPEQIETAITILHELIAEQDWIAHNPKEKESSEPQNLPDEERGHKDDDETPADLVDAPEAGPGSARFDADFSAGERQRGNFGTHILFETFGEYALRLLIEYHHEQGDYWLAKVNDSRLNRAILQRFTDEGLQFAYPTKTLFIDESASEDDAAGA